MKDVVTKYVIAIGDEWFTGFSYKDRAGVGGVDRLTTTVGRGDTPKLLAEDQVKLALDDIRACGLVGKLYLASIVHVKHVGFGALTA